MATTLDGLRNNVQVVAMPPRKAQVEVGTLVLSSDEMRWQPDGLGMATTGELYPQFPPPRLATPADEALVPVELPRLGRSKSEFAREVGSILAPLHVLYRHENAAVEIQSNAGGAFEFRRMDPTRAVTWLEQYIQPGIRLRENPGEDRFMPASMGTSTAATLLTSPQFLRCLPRVSRILNVAVPVRTEDGEVAWPQRGYNPALELYVSPAAPVVTPLPWEEAIQVIQNLHASFPFANEQSRVHAIARLLTPYCRGLMGFGERVPLWFFWGNRSRAGKDYLAQITQIVFLGHAFEDVALGVSGEETRKRITAALAAGRSQMHFANCQGHLNDASFTQSITATTWRDRRLGGNGASSDVAFANEVEFSVSANGELTMAEDLVLRCRRIDLAFFDEHANARTFPRPNLHAWVAANRSLLLSAVHALVGHWVNGGMPPGPTPFTSFPRWAQVVGGVMAACGLGDPCQSHDNQDVIGGDERTAAMRALFESVYHVRPEQWLTKAELYALMAEVQASDDRLEWFGALGTGRGLGEKRAGKALAVYRGRTLGGIRMVLDASAAKSQQHRVRFTRA